MITVQPTTLMMVCLGFQAILEPAEGSGSSKRPGQSRTTRTPYREVWSKLNHSDRVYKQPAQLSEKAVSWQQD